MGGLTGVAVRMSRIGIAADNAVCGQAVCARNKRAGGGILFLTADIAVIVVIGVLQPIDYGIGCFHRAPERFVAQTFRRNCRRESIGNSVALACRFVHQIPPGKDIAVTGRIVHQKGRTVARIDRLHAVATVCVKFQHVIVSVVVAFKCGGAVRRNRLRIVIELCKSDGFGRVVYGKLRIGNDGTRFGCADFVQSRVHGIHIVVDILEKVPHRIRHIDRLVVHIDLIFRARIIGGNIQMNHRRIVRRVHLCIIAGQRNIRLCGVKIGSIAEIGRRDDGVLIRRTALDLRSKAGINRQSRYRVEIVYRNVQILRLILLCRRAALRGFSQGSACYAVLRACLGDRCGKRYCYAYGLGYGRAVAALRGAANIGTARFVK